MNTLVFNLLKIDNLILRITLILFFIATFALSAQKIHPVDTKVLTYPKSFSSIDRLAERIQSDFQTDYDKARAVYVWVANTITYDLKAKSNPKMITIESKSTYEFEQKYNRLKIKRINKTFRSKKGVCQHYSELYQAIAEKVGLKVQLLTGNAKTTPNQIGRSSKMSNHAWNAVWANDRWMLVDATWGSGYTLTDENKFVKEYNDFYFDTPPSLFFKQHFPETGVWLNDTLDRKTYESYPLYYTFFSKKGIELDPDIGVIEANEGDTIQLKIKNFIYSEAVKLGKKETIPLKFNPFIKENDFVFFEFVFKRKYGRNITIFINEDLFAIIKIIPKRK